MCPILTAETAHKSAADADAIRALALSRLMHVFMQRLKGEKIEDEIIELATVLREKADAMVAKTGSINFAVIQPMIDEISVLKNKYK